MGHKATTGAENPSVEEEEIEITPEMIEAGYDAICGANAELSPFVSYEDLAEQVYLAMARLAPKRFGGFVKRMPTTQERS